MILFKEVLYLSRALNRGQGSSIFEVAPIARREHLDMQFMISSRHQIQKYGAFVSCIQSSAHFPFNQSPAAVAVYGFPSIYFPKDGE
jgi:hypothetical protein